VRAGTVKVFALPAHSNHTAGSGHRPRRKNPTLFQAVADALEAAIEVANAGKRKATGLWKEVQKAHEASDNLVAQLNDPGLEFISRPQRIGHFPALLNRVGTPKTKVRD
jgi:hypothetical protein